MRGSPKTDRVLPARGSAPIADRGFTLLELLVAIGVIALVGAGLATIFTTVGRTVSNGERISRFNTTAAILEQQLRQDIATMTREGVLVIRNQVTNNNGIQVTVPLRRDGLPAENRRRRIDEIAFFGNGDFATSRDPLHPDWLATSRQARIYYGHGQRALPGTAADFPRASDSNFNSPKLGLPPGGNSDVNYYASDWTLLRHTTLILPASETRADFPGRFLSETRWLPPVRAIDANWQTTLANKKHQIAGQPAASSVFRSVARVTWNACGDRQQNYLRYAAVQAAGRETAAPRLASGIVDISTMGLLDIRRVITTYENKPADVNACGDVERDDAGFDREFLRFDTNLAGPQRDALERTHLWMADILPTQSDNSITTGGANDPPGVRMRYEPEPPTQLSVLGDTSISAIEQVMRLADQKALSASRCVPRCTEFIVEWSYGIRDRQGEYRWYGTSLGDGRTAPIAVSQYPDTTLVNANPNELTPAQVGLLHRPFEGTEGAAGRHTVNPKLIYGPTPPTATEVQTACFGYVDPFYRKPAAATIGVNGVPTSVSDPDSVPWAWPKLLRITVRQADPKDPTVEQTFQFVLDLPTPNSL